MKLEDIGFYTLSDERVLNATYQSNLKRCELILTDRCNFSCVYCRGLKSDIGGDISKEQAHDIIDSWLVNGLENVRFSGGEPMIRFKLLCDLVAKCKDNGVKRIAISTNGSFPINKYYKLVSLGVDDFSISLDSACCATSKIIAGAENSRSVETIKTLSSLVYVTVGIVFNEYNINECVEVVSFADSLGVSDIRIIPSAQYNKALTLLADKLPNKMLTKYPILKYRVNNIRNGRHIRGLSTCDSNRCKLVLDDMAVAQNNHYPCIIYMREQGKAIGAVGSDMRTQRKDWAEKHDIQKDPICKEMCLDVCIDYNNK